jgi:hypothetical protein
MDFDFSFSFIPAHNKNSNNLLVIKPSEIVINLDDPDTKQQFEDFEDFYTLSSKEGIDFFRFVKQVADSYNTYYSIVHKDDDDEENNSIKINLELDTSSIDAAISKVDILTSKLKNTQLLMTAISNK